MAKSKLELAVETGQWDGGLKKAMQTMNNFIDSNKGLQGALEANSSYMEKFVDMMGTMSTSSDNPKRALRELTAVILELETKYSRLSDTDKNSQFGKAMSTSIESLKKQAGDLKDRIGDLNEELSNRASDTAFTDSMNLMTSTIGSCAQAFVALAGDSEDAKEVLMELAQIQTVVTAVQSLTKAFQEQNAVLLKNPYAVALAGALALGTAIYKLMTSTTQLSEKERLMVDVQREAAKSAMDEKVKLQILTDKLNDNTASIDDRRAALKKIQAIVPEYHASLSKEGKLINNNKEALSAYNNQLIKTAMSQAAFAKIVEKQSELLELQQQKSKQQQELDKRRIVESASGGHIGGREGRMMDTGTSTYVSAAQGALAATEAKIKAINDEITYLTKFVTVDSIKVPGGGGGGGGHTSGSSSAHTSASHVSSSSSSNPKPKPESPTYETKEFKPLTLVEKWNKDLNDAIESKSINLPILDQYAGPSHNGLQANVDIFGNLANSATSVPMSQYYKGQQERAQTALDNFDAGITWNQEAVESAAQRLYDGMEKYLQENGGLQITINTNNIKKSAQEVGLAWSTAASCIGQVSSALSGIDNAGVQIGTAVASAIATIMEAYAQNLAGDSTTKRNIWAFIAAAAASTISMATTIAQYRKAASSAYAEGGIIGGNSFSGDNIRAYVNSGEMVINQTDQKKLYNSIHGEGLGIGSGNFHVVVRGEDLHIIQSNLGRRSKV